MAKTVHYINLDTAVERRVAIEKSFQDTLPHEWKLKRFSAPAARDAENVPGNISPGRKACFLSHRKIIQSASENDDNEMIVEDDCSFSRNAFRIIDEVINRLGENNWDILFLEVGIGDLKAMIELKVQRNRLAQTMEFSLLNLSTLNFFGSLSYVINKRSKHRILNCLNKFLRLDANYDIALRGLFQSGELKGIALFPFITTPSVHAKMSSLSEDNTQVTDEIWIAFRNLMFLDRNLDEVAACVSQIEKDYCDIESRIFGGIVATCVSPQFRLK